MKLTLIPAICFLAFCGSECKKRPFDVRNKYIGPWNFKYVVVTNTMGQETQEAGDYSGRIYYNGKKDGKETIWMEFAPGKNESFELRNEKELFACDEKNGQFDTRNSLTVVSMPVHGCNLNLASNKTFTITADRPD